MPSTNEETDFVEDVQMVVEGVLVPLVALPGLLGNLLSMAILRSPNIDMKVTFREVLTMGAVFDTVFLACVTVAFALPLLSEYWRDWLHPYLFPLFLPILQISLSGSVWSTVSVTVERYLTVVHPLTRYSQMKSMVYILPVVLLTLVWNIPRFWELDTCFLTKNVTIGGVTTNNTTEIEMPVLCPTALRVDRSYTRDYILIANFVAMLAVPFLLITTLNFRLFKTIKTSGLRDHNTSERERRERNIASLLILISCIFCACHLLRLILNVYEGFLVVLHGEVESNWPLWCEVLTTFSHLLMVVNSSANIVVYCWKDEKFRGVLLTKLGCHKVFAIFANPPGKSVEIELVSGRRRVKGTKPDLEPETELNILQP